VFVTLQHCVEAVTEHHGYNSLDNKHVWQKDAQHALNICVVDQIDNTPGTLLAPTNDVS